MPRGKGTPSGIYYIWSQMILGIFEDIWREHRVDGNDIIQMEDVLINGAVHIGSVEGRPATPNKLSVMTGIPRSTVIRRVRRMTEIGVLEFTEDGKTLRIAESWLVGDVPNRLSRRIAYRIRRAADELSRMDT